MLIGHATFTQLAHARDQYKNLRQVQASFNAALLKNSSSTGFESGISVTNGELHSSVLGVELIARPRVVRDGAEAFALEYTSSAGATPDAAPVFRFYLRGDGTISSRVGVPDTSWPACGRDSLSSDLLVRVDLKAISSPLFRSIARASVGVRRTGDVESPKQTTKP